MSEQYEEVLFWEPTAAFHARVTSHVPKPGVNNPAIEPFYLKFDEEAKVRRLTAARQRIAQIRATLQKQLGGPLGAM